LIVVQKITAPKTYIFAPTKKYFMRKLFACSFLFICLCAQAQVPAPKSFLGYEIGSRYTPHYKVVQYYEALAKAAPANMKLEKYGETNEGRPLMLAYISSAENMSNLEKIRLGNLRNTGLEKNAAANTNTAIVWLSYNVHGNETSSSEAGMLTAYELLSSTRGAEWLKNTVVIIDPCLNPDGRDRYVNWFNGTVGRFANPQPQSREHIEPWPGGRSNHYNFDLNRDWAWQTQVETKARIKVYNQWMPHVHVDFHEQGYNEPYYFAPAAEPFHEVITPWQRSFQTQIGRNNAKYFDANGWLYFTKERFDLFYPSYGDTYPTFNGAIGMTFEQGGHSRGGVAVINEDGDTLTLADRMNHHFTTGISTVEMSSKNATDLVKNFKIFFDNANANGVGDYKLYIIKKGANTNTLKKLLEINGIEYTNGNNAQVTKGYNYFTGKDEAFTMSNDDIVVNTKQPRGNMASVLFEPKSKLSDSATYDITAWSLPYAYGLQAYAVKENISTVKTNKTDEYVPANVNSYGFIKSWNNMDDAKFLAALMRKKIKVRMTEKPFEVNGKKYPAGTLIIIKTSNQHIANFNQTVLQIAQEHRAKLENINTGFMDKGADFGSPDVKTLVPPTICIITGEQTSSLGAGEVWNFFDNALEYPTTLVNANDLGRTNLDRFDVIIAPDGFYRTAFGKEGQLKKWVENGGKLIAIEGAVNQIASNEWGLTAKKAPEDKDSIYSALKKFENAERDNLVYNNPGSIFKVELDNTHPLAYGYPNYYYTLKQDDNIYEFTKNGWNVGVIKKENQVAGFTGSKAVKKIKDGVLFGELSVGGGSVIFFTDNPLFRNFWENGKLMICNAIFLANQGRGFHIK
jgi:hypothetical protein